MLVKILLGTAGAFRMAYFTGDIAEIPDEQAKLLIEAKYAEAIIDKEEFELNLAIQDIENTKSKQTMEIPEKKKRNKGI
jgi:hypothetical protein